MRRTAKVVGWLVGVAAIAGVFWALLNGQLLFDTWRVQNFKPSVAIATLAESTALTDRGRHLFYASEPTLLAKAAFNSQCAQDEQTIVLGCYKAQTIYLYDVTDARLNGVEEVTAAHEMLHAAYERLSSTEKSRINALLETQIKGITDKRILELAQLYQRIEPGELLNEMHAILGTEYRPLSPQLEEYYKRYFTDRGRVVSYSESYEAVLSAAKNRIVQLDAELEQLKQQIETNNATLERRQGELFASYDRLNRLRSQNPEAYNAAIPGYNADVAAFNTLVDQTEAAVATYNQLVAERNQQVGVQNDLYESLNSQYQEVPAN